MHNQVGYFFLFKFATHISERPPAICECGFCFFFFAVLWVRLGVAAAAPKEDQDVSNARDAATHGFLSFF